MTTKKTAGFTLEKQPQTQMAAKVSLYEIKDEYLTNLEKLAELMEMQGMGDEIDLDELDRVMSLLDVSKDNFESKAENYYNFIKHMEVEMAPLKAMKEALENEAGRYARLYNAKKKTIEGLVSRLEDGLKSFGGNGTKEKDKDKLTFPNGSYILLQKAKASVDDSKFKPSEETKEYCTMKYSPDKKLIKEILEAEGNVPGCSLKYNRTIKLSK